jgi:hypothetical protein
MAAKELAERVERQALAWAPQLFLAGLALDIHPALRQTAVAAAAAPEAVHPVMLPAVKREARQLLAVVPVAAGLLVQEMALPVEHPAAVVAAADQMELKETVATGQTVRLSSPTQARRRARI